MVKMACPSCRANLRLPESSIGKKGRCLSCGTVFAIEPSQVTRHDPVEDTVVNWLDDDAEAAATQARKAAPAAASAVAAARLAPAAPAAGGPALRSVPPSHHAFHLAKHFDVHLDHVDSMGAFFKFKPQLLYDERFRSIFPQQCVLCGFELNLSVHMVVWSSKLQGGGKTNPLLMKRWVRTLAQLDNASGRELLDQLAPLENLPDPYRLPMPYYVCDSCSPLGAVVATVHPTSDGDMCVLGISSLPQAEAFVVAACGGESEEAKRIHERRREQGDAWRLLPLTVRIRIAQWYKQQEGEHFLTYVPDADFSKAEAGMAGVVVSDRRLIYHKGAQTVEMPVRDPITLQFKPDGKNMRLHINGGPARQAVLLTPEANVQHLRQMLAKHRK